MVYDDTINGIEALYSKRFALLEPYLGIGYIEADGTLDVKGSGSIFDNVFTTESQASDEISSIHYFGGLQLNLRSFKPSIEAARLFDNNRFSLKISLGF